MGFWFFFEYSIQRLDLWAILFFSLHLMGSFSLAPSDNNICFDDVEFGP